MKLFGQKVFMLLALRYIFNVSILKKENNPFTLINDLPDSVRRVTPPRITAPKHIPE